MSGRIMGEVFKLDLAQPELLVLLAYADHAKDDGTSIRPSIALVSWKTRYSERQVRNITTRLVEAGLLVPIGTRNGGRKRANEYAIDLRAARYKPSLREDVTENPAIAIAPFSEQNPAIAIAPFSEQNPAIAIAPFSAETRQSETETRQFEAENPAIAIAPQPSIKNRHLEPSRDESSSSSTTTDDDDELTLLRAVKSYQHFTRQRLNDTQAAEIATRLPRLRGRSEFFDLALKETAKRGKGFPYFLACIDDALASGHPPGSNNGNGKKPSSNDDAVTRRNYYASPKYVDIVEH